jgi:hypothetical protein
MLHSFSFLPKPFAFIYFINIIKSRYLNAALIEKKRSGKIKSSAKTSFTWATVKGLD